MNAGKLARTIFGPLYVSASTGVLRVLPVPVAFAALVGARSLRIPGARLVALTYSTASAKWKARGAQDILSSEATTRSLDAAAEVLLQMRMSPEEAVGLFRLALSPGREPSAKLSTMLASMFFEMAEFERARALLLQWNSPTDLVYFKGHLELIKGDEERAASLLTLATAQCPALMRPHQNLAARSGLNYTPNEIDVMSGSAGRLYDAYNYIGQRVTHVGAGHLGTRLFAGALRAQKKLRTNMPRLSQAGQEFLSKVGISFEELRVLPPEWVTQIGHLGMLDVLFRMRDLGWWKGSALLLAPKGSVANRAMLSLFEGQCRILADAREDVFAEFVSLQRYCGMSFNAFELPSGEVVPWQEAGAASMRQWEAEKRGDHLAQRFDAGLAVDEQVIEAKARAMEEWGIGPRAWYVCLHMRDSSHYGEIEGTGQTHRNAQVSSYLPLIEYVTRQGGFVIKLGGPRSPKLPKMDGLIDYARSRHKSSVMDLCLIRGARYFIGTTSGLTNVAISFGIPCALVNCITVDAQLWGRRVRFAPKRIIDGSGRMLSQRELTSSPWRWRLFSAEVLARHSAVAQDNSADEILEAAKEVERIADAAGAGIADDAEAARLLSDWQRSLGLPHFYGNARPSLHYLHKYRMQFLDQRDVSKADVHTAKATADY
jgi:putative glycosyltransferase (TIGR04372 family)